MTTLQSVPASAAKERARSDVRFPYYNLDASAEVAVVIHREAGGSCDRSQLASYLKYKSITNGSFLTRVTAAKLFGFIVQDGNQLSLTDLGRRVAAPIAANDVERAKAEAFLNVDLFKKVFDATDGQTLPPVLGLRNMLLTKYGIVEARVGPAIRVMLDSADQAGFFRGGDRSRLVRPVFGAASSVAPSGQGGTPADLKDRRDNGGDGNGNRGGAGGGGGGNGGGGFDPSRIHPAIYGLIANLPEAGQLSPAKRDALVAAFTATVKFIYPDHEIG